MDTAAQSGLSENDGNDNDGQTVEIGWHENDGRKMTTGREVAEKNTALTEITLQ